MTSIILPNLKETLVYSACDIINNKLFVCGGCDNAGQAQSTFQMLDLAERISFNKLENMPRVKVGSSICHTETKLITIGGIVNKHAPINNVDLYDVSSQTWSELPDLYQATQNLSVCLKDESIVAVGGLSSGMNTLNTVQMLDLREHQWQKLPQMTYKRYNAGAYIINENIYAMGGREGKTAVNQCECFDFSAGKWRDLPAIPSSYSSIFNSTVKFNDSIVVLGGVNHDITKGFSKSAFKFDISTEKWENMPDFKKPRADFGVIADDSKILIAGGMGHLPNIGQSTELYDCNTKQWNWAKELPTFHGSSSKCIQDNSLFLIGGMSPTGLTNRVTEIQL